jgi:AraC-like DNA-binding protein
VAKSKQIRTILAVDCCNHTIAALETLGYTIVTAPSGKENQSVNLIVTGVTQLPIRRSVINELRRLYPAVPTLILRREGSSGKEGIRGEFILSDQGKKNDLEVVNRVRAIFPLAACEHTGRSTNYGLAQEALKVLLERYSDVSLDLRWVARELLVSPKKLSRVLNQEAGMNFRKLLRNIRVEEAKRMLSSGDYSIKEVAAHVGFSDGHYFSRSFKEVTGQSASEFRASSSLPR